MAMNTSTSVYGVMNIPDPIRGIPTPKPPDLGPQNQPFVAPQPNLGDCVKTILQEAVDKFIKGEITQKQLKDIKKSLE